MVGMAAQKAIGATITGRVQGVGYRYTSLRVAEELGLQGWVRNASDGSVEVWAQWPESSVRAFTEFLRHCPRSARVQYVDVRTVEPDATLEGFRVRS